MMIDGLIQMFVLTIAVLINLFIFFLICIMMMKIFIIVADKSKENKRK